MPRHAVRYAVHLGLAPSSPKTVEEKPTLWLTNIAGWIIPISTGNTSSIRIHFPASYVSLPECSWEEIPSLKSNELIPNIAMFKGSYLFQTIILGPSMIVFGSVVETGNNSWITAFIPSISTTGFCPTCVGSFTKGVPMSRNHLIDLIPGDSKWPFDPLEPLKGSLNLPKKGTKNCQVVVFLHHFWLRRENWTLWVFEFMTTYNFNHSLCCLLHRPPWKKEPNK